MTSLGLTRRLALAAATATAGSTALMLACSGSASNNGDKSPGTDASASGNDASANSGDGAIALGPVDAGAVSDAAGSCANPTVPLIFSPMYSGFIPGTTTGQVFSVPAVTADENPATWSLSDPSQGYLQLQSFQVGSLLVPGVLITLAGAGDDAGSDAGGQVTVIATEASGACGESVLTITQDTLDDWNIGNARYNDGVALHLGGPAGFDGGLMQADGGAFNLDGGTFAFDGSLFAPDAAFGMGGFVAPPTADGGSYFETDGGTACTNCHGPTAVSGPYKTVSHTPEQTGGFSDLDLQNIIWHGEVPDGGYFDPSVLISGCDGGATCTAQAMALWHSFHQWTDITSDELPGVICYLRSLTPAAQSGTANFGGGRFQRPDGGAPP